MQFLDIDASSDLIDKVVDQVRPSGLGGSLEHAVNPDV